MLTHAAAYVPFYRDLFRSKQLSPNAVTMANLAQCLPVISKSDIIANPLAFQSEFYAESGLRLNTSGTTGSPMQILCAREARSINYAFHRKILLDHHCDVNSRKVTFAGRVLLPEREKKIFWRKDLANRTLYCSSYHLGAQTLPGYVAAIERWQPEFIDSYPSAILQVAGFMNERNIRLKLPLRFILTSSETLSAEHRSAIELAFGVKVIDQYGCTEMAVMARNDGAGYVVDPMYAHVEYEPIDGTTTAALICTGLVNFGMPLIRYRIGDVVESPAGVGAKLPQTFARVIGREDDYIVTPEGNKVGRLDPAFKGVSGVRQSQVIQENVHELDVLVVLAPGSDLDAIRRVLTENILARTSRQMRVTVREVQSIALTKAGKFKSVISKVRA
jgi:phenylacetate-CoA ligase